MKFRAQFFYLAYLLSKYFRKKKVGRNQEKIKQTKVMWKDGKKDGKKKQTNKISRYVHLGSNHRPSMVKGAQKSHFKSNQAVYREC